MMAITYLSQYPMSPGLAMRVHLLACHEGAPVPAKQQLRSAQRKVLEDLQAWLDTSKARS